MTTHNKSTYTSLTVIINFAALILALISFSLFFKHTGNSNDLMLWGETFADNITRDSFIFTFSLANLSDEKIGGIHAYVDVYDEKDVLIGYGGTVHDDIIAIRPGKVNDFTAKILLKENYNNIKYAMIIPYSEKGVGKITLSFF